MISRSSRQGECSDDNSSVSAWSEQSFDLFAVGKGNQNKKSSNISE